MAQWWIRNGDENLEDERMEKFEELVYETDDEELQISPSRQHSADDSDSQHFDNEWSHQDSDSEARQLQMAIEASLADCSHPQMNGASQWYVDDTEDEDMAVAIEASLAETTQNLGHSDVLTNSDPPTRPFWPRIQRWLKKRAGPKPVARCFECDRDLEIQGLQENDGHPEPPLILGCGHVVGESCLSQLVDRARVEGADAQCPYCRESIVTGVL
jgi:hypothetical protein